MNDRLYLDIGSNHNGSFHRAIKLIEEIGILKRNIADAIGKDIIAGVKFQVFKADRMYSKEFKSVADVLKNYEVSVSILPKLLCIAKKNNLEFGVSVFDSGTLQEMSELQGFFDDQAVYLKIASSNLLLTDFVRDVASANAARKVDKPLHISTGNSSLSQISDAIRVIKDCGSDMVVYHCQMKYPCDIREANISRIYDISSVMANEIGISDPFSKIAYSDHTRNCMTVLSALSVINTVEMHFDRETGDGIETVQTSTKSGLTHVWRPSDIMRLAKYIHDVDASMYGCATLCEVSGQEIDYRADPSDGLRPMKMWRDL